MLRYLRFAPLMWKSDINVAVVSELAPAAGDTVIDIGAGMGAGASQLLKRDANVEAIEPTPFLRRILKVRTLMDRRKIRVLDGSAEKMPIADGSADAAIAVNTMHHWVDADVAAGELARALRPGGRILLVDEDFSDPTHPEHERWGTSVGGSHGFHMPDPEQMEARFTKAGFASVTASHRTVGPVPAIVVEGDR